MKCPVCHTKTNEAVCPNCGMVLKKETITASTLHSQKVQQSHSFINPNHLKTKIELEKIKANPYYKPAAEKISKKSIIFLVLIDCVWAVIFSIMILRRFL